jgi:hypothetical protein
MQEQPAPGNKSKLRAAPRRLLAFAGPDAAPSSYLIKGLLNKRSYALMYGSPGAGKTFAALDMSYHVAAGRPWHGRRVHAGTVLYLPYEGSGGIAQRAVTRHHTGHDTRHGTHHGTSHDTRHPFPARPT